MAALGEAAVEQRPVLVDLNASAGELRRLFDDTAELATAGRPAIRALGDAAVPGRQAVRAARPQVRELRRFARRTPDLGRNLRILLEDFDDPARAVEPDPRSPGGRGYSGTQALLRYAFSQSLTINAFDELGYMVRAAVHTDKCSPYADAARAKDPDLAECRAWLGPNQPGVNAPDPSPPATAAAPAAKRERAARNRRRGRPGPRARARASVRHRARGRAHPPPAAAIGRPASSTGSSATCSTRRPASRHRMQARCNRSSTTSWPRDPPPEHLTRVEPGPGRRRDLARDRGRGLPGIQRQQRAAVHPHAGPPGEGGELGGHDQGLRGARGRRQDRGRADHPHRAAAQRQGGRGAGGHDRRVGRRVARGHDVHDPPALAAGPEVPGDGARLLRPRGARRPRVRHRPDGRPGADRRLRAHVRRKDAQRHPAQHPGLRQRAGRPGAVREHHDRPAAAAVRAPGAGHAQPVRSPHPPGTPVPRGGQDRARGGAGGRDPGRPVHPLGDHLRGAVGRHRRAQGDHLALAPRAPGRDRLVPGPAPVPDRQRGARARHAAGRP